MTTTIALITDLPVREGEAVTFNVGGAPKGAVITVIAFQNGVEVWAAMQPITSPTFILGGTGWSPWKTSGGGPANCQAIVQLFEWKGHTQVGVQNLASCTFDTVAQSA
jgi:hypothetical protein